MFLHQMLGYDWDEVHAEADRLEHVISEEFEERIAQALGNPSHDPHGDPIPTRDLIIPQTPSLQLADLAPGQKAIVRRVHSASPELLRYLSSLNLVPQTQFTVINCSPFDGNLTLKIADQEQTVVLGPSITQLVYVEII
jgi:DtxR family Mn-dependent transcriptional regulator